MEMRNLQKLIEDKKVELIKLVDKYGFRHQQVLSLSQDIDKLINHIIYINHKHK
ncbi:aspartyl-phosphate phosphatase Spo0E family protein [Bacillus thuringiensis]|jgi:general stress protein 26|uniref:Aspartyl-phosphate phosphatase Spo0E family protein n=1 Tax=Bacillus thuringiensis TaxID=1428 RepID=A0AAW4HZG3_BACTU|nr:aspartyl-phosphate phosphatase Spo0E family protein [Bacillus thuringiensis]MBN9901638.1 aspartyl-phosphate phosphatase Spo0E family protein [Bacillus thuringiensis]MDY7522369.1 aspartyl-phosphate phosphatase Spo0E family protein [Bacillus thuringiensis]MRD39936.1 Spo0E family sporulation regulatory protein-aspartic acid phosphatase [Bacillus thuringiensis]